MRFLWEKRIHHQGLNAFRVIRAATEEDLNHKVNCQIAAWNERWLRVQSAKENRQMKANAASFREQSSEAASKRTEQLRQELESLENLLQHAIAHDYRRDWDSLKQRQVFAERRPCKPHPRTPVVKDPPNGISEEAFRFSSTIWERVMPFIGARRKARLEAARNAAVERWREQLRDIEGENAAKQREIQQENERRERSYEQDLQSWQTSKASFETQQEAFNKGIEEQKEKYLARDPDALLTFWYDLFSTQPHPDTWPEGCFLHYVPGTKTLVVDCELPSVEVFPSVKEVRFIATRNEFKETLIPDGQRKRLYDETLYKLTLASIFMLFQSDVVDALDAVIFNGWVQSIDKATGAAIHPCIVSLQAKKAEFIELNLAHVDARACFKKLKGVCGSRLVDLSPVQPILSLNREDPRFVEGYNVVDSVSEGMNLASMDWLDFENLVRELFAKEFSQNGGEVRITQASRDGGVDAIALDPDPIRGGKIVIQAKRYTNVVGVSAVRDLYGTVHNEGATKGILVTTSDFGPDAYEFAKGKPLTLLSGSELLWLLQRHGYKAKIDLAAARSLVNRAVPPRDQTAARVQ